jgi:hypothetical protein
MELGSTPSFFDKARVLSVDRRCISFNNAANAPPCRVNSYGMPCPRRSATFLWGRTIGLSVLGLFVFHMKHSLVSDAQSVNLFFIPLNFVDGNPPVPRNVNVYAPLPAHAGRRFRMILQLIESISIPLDFFSFSLHLVETVDNLVSALESTT